MHDPFEQLSPQDFQAALDPSQWCVETMLHTSTFEARLFSDTQLVLRHLGGEANAMQFSPQEVRALTRFLVNNVQLEPEEPTVDFKDFHLERVDTEKEGE